jgi:hypothetical protein
MKEVEKMAGGGRQLDEFADPLIGHSVDFKVCNFWRSARPEGLRLRKVAAS